MEDQKSAKRVAAEARQAEYDAMTIQQKLDRLDARFGKDQGATKERAKLQAMLANPNHRKWSEVKAKLSPGRQEQVSVAVQEEIQSAEQENQ